MALPKLNDTPKYNVTIPSMGKRVKFRPYLVKEEKILMMAVESGDVKQSLSAVVDTIEACITDKFDASKLTTFDVEYLFTQIRAKSSGESVRIRLACTECEELNEVAIQLDELKVKVPKTKKLHQLSENISIELRYPPYEVLLNHDFETEDESNAEKSFSIAAQCIDAIIHDDERIDNSECSPEELREFLESMTTEQFKLVSDFVEGMPRLKHDINFDCTSCQHSNKLTLEGMQSFF